MLFVSSIVAKVKKKWHILETIVERKDDTTEGENFFLKKKQGA